MTAVRVVFRVGSDRQTVETALHLDDLSDTTEIRRRIAARGITSPHQFPASAVQIVSTTPITR